MLRIVNAVALSTREQGTTVPTACGKLLPSSNHVPAVEFGPRTRSNPKDHAQRPMQATRNGHEVPPTETYVRKIVAAMKHIFLKAASGKPIQPDRLVALKSFKK